MMASPNEPDFEALQPDSEDGPDAGEQKNPNSPTTSSQQNSSIASAIEQAVTQSGKYGVNLGEGQAPIHIGDRIYGLDAETLRRILKEELWSTEYRTDLGVIRTILREELRLMKKEYGATVNLGLNALAELLQSPAVLRSVTAFQVDFKSARDRIAVISQLKDLHDLLHTIEVSCYQLIVREAEAFPDDSTAASNLSLHHLDFQDLVLTIQSVCQQDDFCISDVSWVSSLVDAEQLLGEAIATLDRVKIKTAIYQIRRVISSQPTRINTQMSEAAKVLRLSELIESMAAIQKKLSTVEVDVQNLEMFGQSIAALADLDKRLAILVISHDYWQAMDMELRVVEGDLQHSLDALEAAWPDIKSRFKPLFDGQQDKWTLLFEMDSENLDTALSENNPAKVRQCFRLYRRRAVARFYKVDSTLKRLCDELSKVGEKLAVVLDVLG